MSLTNIAISFTNNCNDVSSLPYPIYTNNWFSFHPSPVVYGHPQINGLKIFLLRYLQKGFLIAKEWKSIKSCSKLWICLRSAILIASIESHNSLQNKYIHYCCITWTLVMLPDKQTTSRMVCATLASAGEIGSHHYSRFTISGLWEWPLEARQISGITKNLDHSFF